MNISVRHTCYGFEVSVNEGGTTLMEGFSKSETMDFVSVLTEALTDIMGTCRTDDFDRHIYCIKAEIEEGLR